MNRNKKRNEVKSTLPSALKMSEVQL